MRSLCPFHRCSRGTLCPWRCPSNILHPTASPQSVHKARACGWKLSAVLEQGPKEPWESGGGFVYSHAALGHMWRWAMEHSDTWQSHFCSGSSAFVGSIQDVKHRCPLSSKPTNVSKRSLTLSQDIPDPGTILWSWELEAYLCLFQFPDILRPNSENSTPSWLRGDGLKVKRTVILCKYMKSISILKYYLAMLMALSG